MPKITIFFIIISVFFSSCISEPDDTPEHLLRTCFNAIKDNDWQKFRSFVITEADILQKEMGIKLSGFKQKLSYSGGVLKPEQMKEMERKFKRARIDTTGTIKFGDSFFKGIGNKVPIESSYPGSIVYSIKIATSEGTFTTDNAYPFFEIMPWDGKWRILDLIFPTE